MAEEKNILEVADAQDLANLEFTASDRDSGEPFRVPASIISIAVSEAKQAAGLAGTAADVANAAAEAAANATSGADAAIERMTELSDHPEYIGEDYYVYRWNEETKAYERTDIYVKGEGNVNATPENLEAGKRYLFVPDADGSPVGTFQEYVEPVIPEPNESDVTAMFDIPTAADVHCSLKRNPLSGRPEIEIHGVDNSGADNPLMITPPIGMGSNFERTVANGNPIVLRGWHQGVGVDHIIEITEETDSTPSTISIPAACDHFDIVYFSRGGFIQRSYWVDINGVYHPFSAENTPVSALSTPEEPTGIVTIEGQQVIKSNIKIIVFGNDYLSTTAIPRNFMRHFNNLTHMGISGLSNVVTAAGDIFVYLLSIIDPDISALSKLSVINNHFFSNSRLKIIDFLAPLSNVVTINSYFFAYNNTLEKADISPLVKVRSFGTGLFRDCRSLKEIQIGGLDFSVITGDGLNTVSNTPEGILRANSQALADAFKARFPNVSNWTVIINEAA